MASQAGLEFVLSNSPGWLLGLPPLACAHTVCPSTTPSHQKVLGVWLSATKCQADLYFSCPCSLWPSGLKEVPLSSQRKLDFNPHPHCLQRSSSGDGLGLISVSQIWADSSSDKTAWVEGGGVGVGDLILASEGHAAPTCGVLCGK